MAVETKGHIQRLHLLYFHHLVHAAVTTDAADAHRDVRLMVEENVIGKAVHANPFNWLAGIEAFPDLFEPGLCGFTRVWQFMQTSVCGTAACLDLLAV